MSVEVWVIWFFTKLLGWKSTSPTLDPEALSFTTNAAISTLCLMQGRAILLQTACSVAYNPAMSKLAKQFFVWQQNSTIIPDKAINGKAPVEADGRKTLSMPHLEWDRSKTRFVQSFLLANTYSQCSEWHRYGQMSKKIYGKTHKGKDSHAKAQGKQNDLSASVDLWRARRHGVHFICKDSNQNYNWWITNTHEDRYMFM